MTRPRPIHVFLALMLLLSGVLVYQGLSQLIKSTDNTLLTSRLESLEEQQNSLRVDIDAFTNADFVPAAQYQTDQQAITRRLDTQPETQTPDWQSIRDEVTALAAEVERTQQALAQLQQQFAQRPAPSPSPAAAQKPRPKAKPQTPPFDVIGLEYRGGEAFLAISPRQSTSLNDVHLLHPGDSHERWVLQTLEPDAAHFRLPDGRRHSLVIR